MSDNNTATPNPKSRRWLWVALIVSLALNLLFIGVTAGAILMGGPWGPPRHRIMAAAMDEVVQTMPDERRETARKALKRHRAQIKALRHKARQARRATMMVFRNEPFDKEAFVRAAGELRAAENDVRKAISVLATELGQHLTVDERRQFLRTVMRKGRFGRRHRRPDREMAGPGELDQDVPDADDSVQDAPDSRKPDPETPAQATP